jgi:hypothetical protein
MNLNVVEIYYCPYCSKLGKVFNTLIPFESSNYPCFESCNFCGGHFKVVDSLERCKVCDLRLQCLGEPKAIVGAIAIIKKTTDDADERHFLTSVVATTIKNINRIIKKYGRECLKEDFATTQRTIYGNR